MIEIIKDNKFAQLQSVGHAFFTRQGGISKAPYYSLNCSDLSRDKPDDVHENKRRALEYLNLPIELMFMPRMVNGNKVAIVDKPWDMSTRPEADAMVTSMKHAVLAAHSADCPIVLLADEKAEVLGLAHAGWRPAKDGIIEKTVEKMMSLGANQHQIVAVIGPCIAQNSYEVDAVFYQQFLVENEQNKIFFYPSEKIDHYMFDLQSYVKVALSRLALKSISSIDLDTYTDEELFFSYRRALHKNEPDFGGHLSCIYFKNPA